MHRRSVLPLVDTWQSLVLIASVAFTASVVSDASAALFASVVSSVGVMFVTFVALPVATVALTVAYMSFSQLNDVILNG